MTVAAGDRALPDHGSAAGGPWTLLQLLSNHLVLSHTVPYLPVSAILSLAATSRSFRGLLYNTPNVFRHLDLTQVRTAQFDIEPIDQGGEVWRNAQLDENLTEDDFYSGPLRGVFSALRRGRILSDVSTLVLDGLSVTAELVHDILTDPSFSVRILSLREVTNLNERKLRGALQTACRPGRPDGTPRLRGLYIFGAREPAPAAAPGHAGTAQGSGTIGAGWNHRSQEALTSSLGKEGDDDPWYVRRGKMVPRPIAHEWASTLLACAGVLCFDAVLCQGPRHLNSPVFGKVRVPAGSTGSSSDAPSQWAVATHALGGCAGCGSAPEGWTVWGETRDSDAGLSRFPLLAPPPLHSSNTRVACCPAGSSLSPRLAMVDAGSKGARPACPARFIPRCAGCLRDRYCWCCNAWWCETCFAARGPDDGQAEEPSYKARVRRSCWECGPNCHDCIERRHLTCRSCCGGYCIIHNEGCTLTKCDWCSARGRRTRAHY